MEEYVSGFLGILNRMPPFPEKEALMARLGSKPIPKDQPESETSEKDDEEEFFDVQEMELSEEIVDRGESHTTLVSLAEQRESAPEERDRLEKELKNTIASMDKLIKALQEEVQKNSLRVEAIERAQILHSPEERSEKQKKVSLLDLGVEATAFILLWPVVAVGVCHLFAEQRRK